MTSEALPGDHPIHTLHALRGGFFLCQLSIFKSWHRIVPRMAQHRPKEIRAAILDEVFWASTSPVPIVAERFGVTRQAVQKHVTELVSRRRVLTSGRFRFQRFRLPVLSQAVRAFRINSGFSEDTVWNRMFRARLEKMELTSEQNDILHYGLTEMVNNVIDHADASRVKVTLELTAASINLTIRDDGIGIFRKISEALHLSDPRQSLLELSKGKFTTDPRRHTGEGIYFCARMFDRFAVESDRQSFVHTSRTADWVADTMNKAIDGTSINMKLLLSAERSTSNVFSDYSSGPEDYRFAKTQIPIKLATFGDETLISRSSARRVLSRVDQFDEVILDFAGVRIVGQAFADEVFRVFCREYPHVKLIVRNAETDVQRMIRRARAHA